MPTVYVVGGLSNNSHPINHKQVFVTVPMSYGSFDEAANAAVEHWRMNYSNGRSFSHRAYQSVGGSPKAVFVEITDDAGLMTFVALYKILEMELVTQ